MAYDKPLPKPNVETQPFWDACREHRLLVQCCNSCGNRQFYPRSLCTQCHGADLGWQEASGRGSIYSFTVIRRAPSAAFKPDLPYVLALVELEDSGGVRMMSNVVDCDPDGVRVDMKVELLFDDVTAEISLPKFRPAGGEAARA